MTRYRQTFRTAFLLAAALALANFSAVETRARDYGRAQQNYYFPYARGPGSLYYWEYGRGPGSAYYWRYGKAPASAYHWQYGKSPGSAYYWQYGKSYGSAYYWQYGKGERSQYAWRYGRGGHSRYAWNYARYRVLSPVMTALCLSGALEIAPCLIMQRAAHHHRALGHDYAYWYRSNGLP